MPLTLRCVLVHSAELSQLEVGHGIASFTKPTIVGTDSLVLTLQFRPPVGKVCVEFPAGLLDQGDTAKATAIRELKEETGLSGNCILI